MNHGKYEIILLEPCHLKTQIHLIPSKISIFLGNWNYLCIVEKKSDISNNNNEVIEEERK